MVDEDKLDLLIAEAAKLYVQNLPEEKVDIEVEFSKEHKKKMKKIFKMARQAERKF